MLKKLFGLNKSDPPTSYSRGWLIDELDRRSDTVHFSLNAVQCTRAISVLADIFTDMGEADAVETVRSMVREEQQRRSSQSGE